MSAFVFSFPQPRIGTREELLLTKFASVICVCVYVYVCVCVRREREKFKLKCTDGSLSSV